MGGMHRSSRYPAFSIWPPVNSQLIAEEEEDEGAVGHVVTLISSSSRSFRERMPAQTDIGLAASGV